MKDCVWTKCRPSSFRLNSKRFIKATTQCVVAVQHGKLTVLYALERSRPTEGDVDCFKSKRNQSRLFILKMVGEKFVVVLHIPLQTIILFCDFRLNSSSYFGMNKEKLILLEPEYPA